MSRDPQLQTHQDWVLRVSAPENRPERLMLALHGWTGDENSMWIFTRNLPAGDYVVSPRAPFPSDKGGYSWREILPGSWGSPTLDELKPAVDSLIGLVDDLIRSTGIGEKRIDLMGFSQGGALVNAIALLHPGRVRKAAALAGFVPYGADGLIAQRQLEGIPFFVAHGSSDELVPVERAHQSVAALRRAGADVTFCPSEVGHKVSAECLKSLEEFFSK